MRAPIHIRANSSAAVRREQYLGRPHIVVPVVMLRETVVNGAFVPAEELSAAGWNGVPVTVHHPTERGHFITANSPRAIEQWAVGNIFNSKLDGDRLKGEAWIDEERAEEIAPGLVAQLQSGERMDVSTGYFPTTIPEKGVYDGRAYNEVHADLKPDHLALLPGDVGACSWADGCGVRVNKRGILTMKRNKGLSTNRGEASAVARLLAAAGITSRQIRNNDRSPDNDRRQIVADLIAAEASPFTADDMDGLLWLTDAVLQALRETYLEDGDPLGEDGDGDGREEDAAAVEEMIEAQRRAKGKSMKNNRSAGCGCHGAPPAANARKTSATIGEMSPVAFAQLMANAMRGALSANAEEEQVEEIIRRIMEDPENVFTEEDLRGMSLDALEKLLGRANEAAGEDDTLGEEERQELEAQRRNASLRKPRVNFSGRATGKPSGGDKKYPSMVGNKAAITGK